MLLTTLVLTLAAYSAGATLLALRTVKESTQAKDNFATASAAVDRMVEGILSSKNFKGKDADAARQDVLQAAKAYYETFLLAIESDRKLLPKDRKLLPEEARSHLHLAAIQAKAGEVTSIESLSAGIYCIAAMRVAKLDAGLFPSLQSSALNLVAPTDWLKVTGGDQDANRFRQITLFLILQSSVNSYEDLVRDYPQSEVLRDDLTALLKASATFQTFAGRTQEAKLQWVRARDVLETLVREKPAHDNYKIRLIEAAEAVAKLQKDDQEAAIANYRRAIELREQLLAANPDDQTLQKTLASAKEHLEKLQTAPATQPVATEAATAPEETAVQ